MGESLSEPLPNGSGGEMFRRIVEACPFAILVADDEGRYLEANPMACQLFGRSRAQLLGKRVYDFVDPGDILPTQVRWESFREDKNQAGEFPLVRPDGSRRILRYRAVADFAPGLHASFLEDVSEARDATVRESIEQDRFRTVADGLPLVIWIGDAQGASIYYNRHWYQYTGLEPPADGGRDTRDSAGQIHPEDLERIAPILRDRRARGLDLELTYRLRRYDGAYRWHLARSLPIRDASGKVVWRVGAATDIEDQRQAIEDLKIERVLRERFVAALSHDLRSPLHAINMSAQLILKRPDRPEACQTQAGRIVRNVAFADQLIQNLLDASRITAGEVMAIERTACDLHQLVRDVLDDQSTIFGDRFDLDAPGGLQAPCDRAAIRRTLENLIGNAIKYGHPHTRVRVALAERDGEVTLAVHNQGNPIPEDERAKIFQPYHRAQPPNGAGTGPRGWGLGLTLVRGIAEAHGGTVRVESSAETGTTFTVTLGKT